MYKQTLLKTFSTRSGMVGSVTKHEKEISHGTQKRITYIVTVNGVHVCEEHYIKILDIDCILTPGQRHNWRIAINKSNLEKESEVLRKINASVKYRMRM